MYPNPQDVLPLPSRPDVEQYRSRAKELVRAHREGDEAVAQWARRWIDALAVHMPHDAPPHARDAERHAAQVARFARDRLATGAGALSQAQFVIARAHGFTSWTRLLQHLHAAAHSATDSACFERAADAIVQGDLDGLTTLLAGTPALVHARSDREHGATLLHYVAANGVENYRQRTPANIVTIAQHLLDAGSDVNATCDVYGGGAMTLGLTATSAHPRAAGVQLALMDLLEARGARVDSGGVRMCLANGCPEAAAWYADRLLSRGEPLTLAEAAGIGRVDLLPDAFARERQDASRVADALQHAAWYDRLEVVTWLLEHGVPVDMASPDGGDTALHQAAYLGHGALVSQLLARGASVHALDTRYGSPPLVWALHAWLVEQRGPADRYRAVVLQLLDAGATVRADWIDDERLRADAELFARCTAALAPG